MHVHEAPSVHRPLVRPATDILDKGDGLLMLVNLPGVPGDDIMVEVDRGELAIRGLSRFTPSTSNGGSVLELEFVDVEYRVRIALSDDIDALGIRATLHNGVLAVTLPRLRPRGPRRIFVVSY